MIRLRILARVVLGVIAVSVFTSGRIWGQADQSKPSLASQTRPEKIAGPRELLQLYEIDKSHFDRLTNGIAWQENEGELLYRILFRLRDFRLMDIESWTRPLPHVAELAVKSENAWGEFYQLKGRVTGVMLCQPLAEGMDRFEMTHYYRVEFQLGEERQPASFSRRQFSAWKPEQPIDERAGAVGSS